MLISELFDISPTTKTVLREEIAFPQYFTEVFKMIKIIKKIIQN